MYNSYYHLKKRQKPQKKLPIKDSKLRDESFVDGDQVGDEAVHDGVGHGGGGVVHREGLLSEAVHRRGVGGDSAVAAAEYLLPNGLERVAGVRVHVVRLVPEEEPPRARVGRRERVRLRAIDAVYLPVEPLHPAQHVVERPVLHHQNHHGFYGAADGGGGGDEEEECENGGGGHGWRRETERGERE